jgi:hypothetical protein
MKRKRTSIDDPTQGFSPEVLETWRYICRLYHDGYDESDRMVRDEAIELHRMLGLKPWHPFVIDVGSVAEEFEPPDDPSHLRDWLMVRDIRRRLVEAT